MKEGWGTAQHGVPRNGTMLKCVEERDSREILGTSSTPYGEANSHYVAQPPAQWLCKKAEQGQLLCGPTTSSAMLHNCRAGLAVMWPGHLHLKQQPLSDIPL